MIIWDGFGVAAGGRTLLILLMGWMGPECMLRMVETSIILMLLAMQIAYKMCCIAKILTINIINKI